MEEPQIESAAPGAGGARQEYPLRWLVAVVMIGAATMDLIHLTFVNVALPTLRRDLGATRGSGFRS